MFDPTAYICQACGQAKPQTAFSPDRRSRLGIHSSCRACRAEQARQQRASRPRLALVVSVSDLMQYTDRWASQDGVGGWHWRWVGKETQRTTRAVLLRRLYHEMYDAEAPYGTPTWCGGEAPWCINPAHVTLDDTLTNMSVAEVFGTGSGISRDAMRVTTPPPTAEALRALEEMPPDPSDRAADEFLAAHGFDRYGRPL